MLTFNDFETFLDEINEIIDNQVQHLTDVDFEKYLDKMEEKLK